MAAKKKWSRDQKRALKKAKRTPPPRGAQALRPSPSLLQPLHKAGWDNYTVLHYLPQTEKMGIVPEYLFFEELELTIQRL